MGVGGVDESGRAAAKPAFLPECCPVASGRLYKHGADNKQGPVVAERGREGGENPVWGRKVGGVDSWGLCHVWKCESSPSSSCREVKVDIFS